MEQRGRREAPPDDKLSVIRDRRSRISLPLHAAYMLCYAWGSRLSHTKAGSLKAHLYREQANGG